MPASRRQCLSLFVLAPALVWFDAAADVKLPALRVVGSADFPFRIFATDGASGAAGATGGQGVSGLYFDLIKEAARRLDWPLHFEEMPSARALSMLEQGEADLMLGLLRTPERERHYSYCRVALPAENKAFYTLASAPVLASISDLEGRLLAVHRGKRYGLAFDADPSIKRQEFNDYPAALRVLVRGRVDVVIMPERQGDLLLRSLSLQLEKQPLRLLGEPNYIVLSRRSPWLARQAELERTLQAMRDDGTWKRIFDHY